MTLYVIRIELEGSPSWQTYDLLHQRLANLGVFRTLRGRDGISYELPHATYGYERNDVQSTDNVLNWLKPQISGLGHRYKILVTNVLEWSRPFDNWSA